VNNPRVWAPEARSVKLVVRTHRFAMQATPGGWWVLDQPQLPVGTDYRFEVDDGPPTPDPRSAFQPFGVHGPSRTVDHAAFDWTDRGWRAPPLASAVVYELHVGTFTPEGTFQGVQSRLAYLAKLGVTHVELMPVNEYPGSRGWGYDGVDLYAPHHAYGGPAGLKRLVDACHAQGLAVLLDVVYNHLGPDGNYLERYGPYFTEAYQTPWGKALNLDQAHSDEVRRFICDNALMWLRDYHFDGLRLDAVHALLDRSARHLLEQLGEEVLSLEGELGRPLTLIAESDLNDPRVVRPREVGGYGMHAQWSDDLHHALHARITGERAGYYVDFGRLEHIARALRDGYVYSGQYSEHRQRRHGRSAATVPKRRFLGYLQTHDQVGNRAQGDRIGHLAPPARVRVAAALALLSPFVPLLFQGEEWNASTAFCYFTDHQDPELGHRVSVGRRSEFSAFGWLPEEVPDPQDPETFQRSRLNWDEADSGEHGAMLDWYRALLRLRRDYPDLTREAQEVRFDEAAGWLVLKRAGSLVAANLGEAQQRLPLPAGATLLLGSGAQVRIAGDELWLPVDSVAVVALERTAE
jgi:maltooligosyltrehalose trehalohydrolase